MRWLCGLEAAEDVTDEVGQLAKLGVVGQFAFDQAQFVAGHFSGEVTPQRRTVEVAPGLLLGLLARPKFTGDPFPRIGGVIRRRGIWCRIRGSGHNSCITRKQATQT